MLVFQTHCQLGNQMFIFACAKSLSKKRKVSFALSDVKLINSFFHIPFLFLFRNKLNYIFFRIQNLLFRNYIFNHFQDNRIDYSKRLLDEKSKNAWYYGYFQGENYFYQNENDIKKLFQIKSKHQQRYIKIKQNFDNLPTIVVHIRLRDYKTFGPDYLNGPDLTLPFSYYKKIINEYDLNKYELIFTSDDISEVKTVFESEYPNAYFSENDAIIDFMFIKNADIAIISHSTFAWWAVWLSDNKLQKVLVPEYFLGFKVKSEYPVNIIPSEWEKVCVF